jgi:type II secretory pathway component GspD/PulD (secretin)
MLTAHTVGTKYQEVKNLSVVEIAKLVRKDLKQFNDCKFSVNSDRNTITIYLKDSPLNKLEVYDQSLELGWGDKVIAIEKNFRNKVKEILDQYNFNNSEIMTDYFHVNFYSHFYLDSDLENKYKDQLLSKEAA